jgi:hypothetical protein
MHRYKKLFDAAQAEETECHRTNQCSGDDMRRLEAEQSVYTMLFYSARASLYHVLNSKQGKVSVPESEEIQ